MSNISKATFSGIEFAIMEAQGCSSFLKREIFTWFGFFDYLILFYFILFYFLFFEPMDLKQMLCLKY